MEVTWLHNLGKLCNQIGQVLERHGQECLCHADNTSAKKGDWVAQADIDKEQSALEAQKSNFSNVGPSQSVPNSTMHEKEISMQNTGTHGTVPLATSVVQTTRSDVHEGKYLVDTESEATDNELWVSSQQSKQSNTTSTGESVRNSNTVKKTATRWRKGADDDRLIKIVENCVKNQTVTTEKAVIDKVVESLGNVHSFQQVRYHYRRLHKENRLPLEAPV
ncbi:hypothetical protein Gasu2_33080 [Galdieria sulphuraria]|uniref:Myb-like domain-containing protein n=1 Tax=Galdieria sulphuraria TaxID=130081 RepID=M2Y482_GALSU|nr:uncharacterized protein Gasu_20980 [Galdieria sulphuraria]EME30639.1 hypothetical protein Gasu_20980 [Galdieria sulphuraria]GJD09036.1 hypothetical protein Gasu2_33080 [Galdieria sulphuraria]|eukprot:XP_005707159.1 hypothetical protein Gasu_20980 [Galdieria sulphuraria]